MAVIDGVDLDDLDYIVQVPYNGTGATGGDSLTENLNIWYEVSWPPVSEHQYRDRVEEPGLTTRHRQEW